MENEISKTKIVFAAAVGIVFVVMIALFIVAVTKQEINKMSNQQLNTVPISQSKTGEKEIVPNKDKIDFEDPGNDEIGQDIKELDALINNTTPNELSGDDLSDEMIEK